MSEIKCYGLEVINENINGIDELEYIRISATCNKHFVGVSLNDGRDILLFKDPKGRNECYMRILNHFNEPKVAIVLETALVDTKYLKTK